MSAILHTHHNRVVKEGSAGCCLYLQLYIKQLQTCGMLMQWRALCFAQHHNSLLSNQSVHLALLLHLATQLIYFLRLFLLCTIGHITHTVEQMHVASLQGRHMYWTTSVTKEAFSILLLFSIGTLLLLSLKQSKKLAEGMQLIHTLSALHLLCLHGFYHPPI